MFYAVGGRDRIPEPYGSDCNQVCAYDPATNQWHAKASLIIGRHRPGVAVLDGYLYAIGGASGKLHLNSAERYSPERDQWELVAPMSSERVGVAAVVVNRLLYAIGGFNGSDRLSTVECFHPEENQWKQTIRFKLLHFN